MEEKITLKMRVLYACRIFLNSVQNLGIFIFFVSPFVFLFSFYIVFVFVEIKGLIELLTSTFLLCSYGLNVLILPWLVISFCAALVNFLRSYSASYCLSFRIKLQKENVKAKWLQKVQKIGLALCILSVLILYYPVFEAWWSGVDIYVPD